jgi:hypothetical protein
MQLLRLERRIVETDGIGADRIFIGSKGTLASG